METLASMRQRGPQAWWTACHPNPKTGDLKSTLWRYATLPFSKFVQLRVDAGSEFPEILVRSYKYSLVDLPFEFTLPFATQMLKVLESQTRMSYIHHQRFDRRDNETECHLPNGHATQPKLHWCISVKQAFTIIECLRLRLEGDRESQLLAGPMVELGSHEPWDKS